MTEPRQRYSTPGLYNQPDITKLGGFPGGNTRFLSAEGTFLTPKLRPSSVFLNNVKDFGAMGDGVNDDTIAIVAAVNAGKPFFFPPGTYLISAGITQTVNVYGSGAGITFIKASTTLVGRTWTINGGQYPLTLQDITITSSRTAANEPYNQTGIFDQGTINNSIENVRIDGFDNKSLEVGDPSIVAGSFWALYKNIRIRSNTSQTANYGVYINGSGVSLNSNDSLWLNVVVSGAFTVPYFIGGNNHVFIGGGAEWTTGAGVTAVYQIDGNNNRIERPYVEYTSTKPVLATFTSAASNNKIIDVNEIYFPNGALDAFVSDLGVNNHVSLSTTTIGQGFYDASIRDEWSPNLFMNAGFTFWRSATAPWGFSDTTGVSQDTTTVTDGVSSSMKMTTAANVRTANCTIDDSVGALSTHFRYPISMFAGKELFWQCKCKTSIADAGVLMTVLSPSGNQNLTSGTCHHTANGEWQTLTLVGSVKADATSVILSLRSSVTATNSTGDFYWCAPVIKVRQAKWKESVQSDRSIFFNSTLQMVGSTALRSFTVPDVDDQLVGKAASQTLTTKTITAPIFNTFTEWTNQGAAAAASGRLQRNVAELSWHNGTAATNLEQVGRKDANNGYAGLDGSGNVPIAHGGTGQATQTAAMNALSPTTTKGDLLVDNGTDVIRVAVGADDEVLTADSGQASGVKWAAATATVPDPNQQAYAPGSFTVEDGKYVIMAKELQLTGSEEVILEGTGRLVIV